MIEPKCLVISGLALVAAIISLAIASGSVRNARRVVDAYRKLAAELKAGYNDQLELLKRTQQEIRDKARNPGANKSAGNLEKE